MNKCAQCNNAVDADKAATCAECSRCYHPACCKLRTITAFKSRKTPWICSICKEDGSKSDVSEETDDSVCVKKMLQQILSGMEEDRRTYKSRFDDLDTSISSVKNTLTEYKAKIDKLEEDFKKMADDTDAVKEENTALKEECKQLRIAVMDMQQYSRRNNVEIKGIPFTSGEDVYAVLTAVAGALRVQFNKDQLSVAHRTKARESGHPPIVASFISRQVRAVWLEAAKKYRLDAKDVSPRFQKGAVYVNAHLAPHTKRLLGCARKLFQEKKLHAAWATEDGRVLVRRTEGGPTQRVTFIEDLDTE